MGLWIVAFCVYFIQLNFAFTGLTVRDNLYPHKVYYTFESMFCPTHEYRLNDLEIKMPIEMTLASFLSIVCGGFEL